MSHHEHHGCEHSVAYCKRCDVVYCKLCNREWGGTSYWYIPRYYPTTTTPFYINTTTGSASASTSVLGTFSSTTGGCSHQES